MTMGSSRTERAWKALEPWVRKWYVQNPEGHLFITGGFNTGGILYLPSVDFYLAVSFLQQAEARSLEVESQEVDNGRELNSVDDFVAAYERADVRDCVCISRAVLSLPDRPLEVTIYLSKETETQVNLTFMWPAVETFFNARNLEARFLSIVEYFFSLQQRLNTPRLYFGDSRSFRKENLETAIQL